MMIRFSSVVIFLWCAFLALAVVPAEDRQPPQWMPRPPVVFPPPVELIDVEIDGEVVFHPTVQSMKNGTSGWIDHHNFYPHSKQIHPSAEVYDEPKGSFDLRFKVDRDVGGKYKVTIPKGYKFSKMRIVAC